MGDDLSAAVESSAQNSFFSLVGIFGLCCGDAQRRHSPRLSPLEGRPPSALAIMGLEELKQRIHNFRMPIRNPRLLLAVKMVYLFTPVVLGYGVMQLVIPDPEELKKAMSPPSEAAAALTKHQKDGLRDVLEPARARHAQAQAQR